jgi:pimeloyl-ACP methyl ester carboxylesterase
VRRLVLGGPPLLTQAQLETLIPRPVTVDEEGEHLASTWRRIRAKDPSAPLELSNRETVLTLAAGEHFLATYRAVFAHDLGADLQAIEQKTLVFAGPEDTVRASLEPAFARLQRGSMRVLPRGGTYVCDREPALVAGLLREFFAEERS